MENVNSLALSEEIWAFKTGQKGAADQLYSLLRKAEKLGVDNRTEGLIRSAFHKLRQANEDLALAMAALDPEE